MNELKEKEMKWYTIRVMNNREKKVSERLKTESDVISQIIIPTEFVYTIKDGKRIAREKTLYPGYIFVQTGHVGELEHLVKQTDGASGVLKDKSGNHIPLKQREIDDMIGKSSVKKEELNITFITGEEVTVEKGPFSKFKGTVEEVDYDKKKLKVSVLIFGRKTPIDLDISDVTRSIANV